MPTIEDRLQDDIKAAMKAGKKDDLEVLRTVMAEAKNAAIQEGINRTGLSDELMTRILRKGVKSRNEAIELYQKGGRQDLVDKETFQIGVLERYLPAAATDAEIEAVVEAVLAETGAKEKSAMGAVMKESLARLAGRADGKSVSKIVAGRLA